MRKLLSVAGLCLAFIAAAALPASAHQSATAGMGTGTAVAEQGAEVNAVQNFLSGRCIDVYAFNVDNGAGIVNWDCNGQTNQRWEFRPAGDGVNFYLIAGHSGKCLTADTSDHGTGQRINQWQCVGGDNQMWRKDYKGNNTYELQEKRTGYSKCLSLDTRPGLGNGSPYLSWPCEYGTNQRFYLNAA